MAAAVPLSAIVAVTVREPTNALLNVALETEHVALALSAGTTPERVHVTFAVGSVVVPSYVLPAAVMLAVTAAAVIAAVAVALADVVEVPAAPSV